MSTEIKQRFPLRSAYPFAAEHGLSAEIEEIQQMEIEWNRPYGPTVRRGYVIELLGKHDLLKTFISDRWPLGATKSGNREIASCLRIKQDFEEFIFSGALPDDAASETESNTDSFAFEAHLRDFLSRNIERLEKGLRLFERDGKIGIEYPVDGGRIDLLAIDPKNAPVVIELKLSSGRNKALGQLLYYMGWIDKNLGANTPSRGIIVASEISDELVIAASRVPSVSLARYNLAFSIEPIKPFK